MTERDEWEPERFLQYAYRVIHEVCYCRDPDPNDLLAAILHMPQSWQDALEEEADRMEQDG